MKTLLMLSALALVCGCNCGDPCAEGGQATIEVRLSGVPDGLSGKATLSGPGDQLQTATANQTFTAVGSGHWSVTADKVVKADPRVRTVWGPTATPDSFCVGNGQTQVVEVAYAEIPTSHKVWTANSSGGSGSLLAFSAPNLTAGTHPADVSAQAPNGRALAFDRNGNLWSPGGTGADAALVRIAASSLGSSGARVADRSINIAGLDCLPRVSGIAFDSAGNLWVASPCKNTVMRLPAASLEASATVTASLTLSDLADPGGLAFDAAGNLWVANSGSKRLFRYDTAGLAGTTAGPATLRLGARATDTVTDTSLLTPNWVGIDTAGNLWANDFGANVLFRLAAADLTGTGESDKVPAVRVTLDVAALMEGFAFDEEGGLWTAFSAGKVARLAPSQLLTSTGAGAPTVPEVVLSSSDLGSAASLALYPAPAGLPLFHRLP